MTADPSILHPTVRQALDAHAIEYEVLACEEHLADTAEFCAHYGISPQEACNTIVVTLKTTPRQNVACLIRADTKLDVNHRVSALVGVKRLSFASAEETAEISGMLIGGVTVIGLPPEVPVYIDDYVLEREHIIVGGGNRTSKIRLDPRQLERVPNVSVAGIAVPR